MPTGNGERTKPEGFAPVVGPAPTGFGCDKATGGDDPAPTNEATELIDESLLEELALLRSLLNFAAAAACSGENTVEGCIAKKESTKASDHTEWRQSAYKSK
jgi:hypothetical protein